MGVANRECVFYIGWDVGGWNCDKNANSRDAIVILDESCSIMGIPWRGNLRQSINESRNSTEWIHALFKLCDAGTPPDNAYYILSIDTPLGFSQNFQKLLNGDVVNDPIGASASNPYLFRQTEHFLFEHGLTPLSAVKDMIGSQATKGIHVLAKFAQKIISTGVWSDGEILTAIEAYPSACKTSITIKEFLLPFIEARIELSEPAKSVWDGAQFITMINHEDKRDALLCALIAWLYQNKSDSLMQPNKYTPQSEGWIFVPNDVLQQSKNTPVFAEY